MADVFSKKKRSELCRSYAKLLKGIFKSSSSKHAA